MAKRETEIFKQLPAAPLVVPSQSVGAQGVDPSLVQAEAALRGVSRKFDARVRAVQVDEIARAKAASKAISNTIELQVEGEIDRASRMSPLDPGAIQGVGEGVIEQAVSFLPELAQPAFIEKWRNSLAVKVSSANSASIKITQEKATLNAEVLDAQRTAELARISRDRFSSEPEKSDAANTRLQTLFNDRRAAMGETFIDYFGVSQPLFTLKQQTDSFINDRNLSLVEGMEGRFDESPNKADTLLEYMNGDFKVGVPDPDADEGFIMEDPLDLLPDRGTSFLTGLTKKLNHENKIITAREKEEAALIKGDQDITEIAATDSILNPDSTNPRITFEQTKDAGITGQMRLKQVLRIQALLNKEAPAVVDNLNVENFIRDGIAAGIDMGNEIADAVGRNQLKDGTAIALGNLNRSEELKAIERDVKSMKVLIGTASEFAGPLDPIQVQAETFREDAAIVEFRERALGLPIEERIDLRNKIIERAKLDPDIIGTNRLIVPEGLGLSRAQIGAKPIVIKDAHSQLKRDFKAGKVNRRTYARRSRELMKWQNAIGAMSKITGKPIPESGKSAAVKAAQGK